ncbi:MAG: DUF3795 domain-containing protein [Candidatus Lokiarchaeota archaeon]|nr:DUF3795 domain-containing protein [Candidatus Lokiarchaeota archaeon]
MSEKNLAAPCGMYCGACRSYLILKKNLLEEKGRKNGCKGCRIRNKNCSFIKKDCALIRKNEIDFCFECDSFPCSNLQRIDGRYSERYNVSFIQNLKRIQEIGFERWLEEQEILYRCPDCGGEISVHDKECFDCGKKINPNLK